MPPPWPCLERKVLQRHGQWTWMTEAGAAQQKKKEDTFHLVMTHN